MIFNRIKLFFNHILNDLRLINGYGAQRDFIYLKSK